MQFDVFYFTHLIGETHRCLFSWESQETFDYYWGTSSKVPVTFQAQGIRAVFWCIFQWGRNQLSPRQRQESLQKQLFKSRLLHWIWAERLLVWDSVGSLRKTMVVYWIIGFYMILLLVSIDCNVPGWWLETKVESHVKASKLNTIFPDGWWRFIVDILWRKQMQKHTHWRICCSTLRGFIPIPNQLGHLGRWQTYLNCQL